MNPPPSSGPSRRFELVTGPSPATHPANAARRRKGVGIGIAACSIALVALVALTWVAGWAPLAHQSCGVSGVSIQESEWVPVLYVNAPFGGYVTGNATTPQGLLRGDISGFGSSNGMPASNGTVGGVFFHLNLTVIPVANQTEWGPGVNSRCTSVREIFATADFVGSQVYSGILPNEGGVNDSGESHVYNLSSGSGDATPYGSNGFVADNSASVSTCGGPAVWRHVTSSYLRLSLPSTPDGSNWVVPLNLVLSESFGYWFPSNFGTWQVDNLTAPGGPGGGWAFSYSPCA